MPDVKIVIGANYGDEGKGLMTDYFCHEAVKQGKKVCVVLSNGGAQRGHTVETPDGKRHVFHQYGSGFYAGADTFLPSKFILNPLEFYKEYYELNRPLPPSIFVHPECRVTTPWDMMANMMIEESRGDKKHGSCGMGIWETIRRSEVVTLLWGIVRRVPDIYMTGLFMPSVYRYYENRLHAKGITKMDSTWEPIFYDKSTVNHFLDFIHVMDTATIISNSYDTLNKYDLVVFENAQGLMLSEDNKKDAPHTTPSKTGLDNPLEIMKYITAGDVEICYVTRSYITRHGNGNLPHECFANDLGVTTSDRTNGYNRHQGYLRYAEMDARELVNRISKDYAKADPTMKCSLAVTHLNEHDFPLSDQSIADNFNRIYFTYGHTRNEVNVLR